MRRFWLIMAVAVLIQLCGCGLSGINEEIEADGNIVKLNYVPDLNYYKKPQSPSLITDRLGYEPSARKMVYLIREEADTDFYIYNVDTGDCVFRGVMSKMDMAGDELQHLYIGDFSDLNIAGNYRVLQNDVGYSDQFTIENDLYINLYKSTYSKIATASYSRTSDLIFVLSNLMMTNEIYGESYIDQAFVNSSVEKLIKCQDAASGAVYDRLVENEGEPGMESLATTAEFAGLMAQYYIINSNEPDELLWQAHPAKRFQDSPLR